ncbi:MAG: DUF4968 domain-containing protein, partial [Bacteroides sp.]|nr:DUF4968 domain-containing protein [Bacteroides sp.]
FLRGQGGDTPLSFPEENEIFFQAGKDLLRIRICSERMIRFTKNNSGEFPKESDLIIIRKDWKAVRFTTIH